MIVRAVRDGLARAGAVWGLVALVLLVNLGTAAVLAVPLHRELRQEFEHRETASQMMYAFDFNWWSRWSDDNARWSFGPDILGTGFAFKNLDLLLRGWLPAGLFVLRDGERRAEDAGGLDPLILAAGLLYLLVQVFLAGGILGVLRAPQPTWTVRGLLHGSGFYCGRLLRLALLVLVVLCMVFAVYAPGARWVDDRAREAVSERTAMAWLFGRHIALLLALLFVHMVASYARVIVVLEERASALLALLSSITFCLRNVRYTLGHLLAMAALAVAILAVLGLVDRQWTTVGYKTQLVTLVLLEGFVFARIFLRVATLGGQVWLYRRLTDG